MRTSDGTSRKIIRGDAHMSCYQRRSLAWVECGLALVIAYRRCSALVKPGTNEANTENDRRLELL